jgi:hypothetical protein
VVIKNFLQNTIMISYGKLNFNSFLSFDNNDIDGSIWTTKTEPDLED